MRDLSPAEQSIIDTADRIGRETVEKNAESWNAAGEVPRAFFAEAAAAGLCKLVVPQAQDGLDLSVTAMARIGETMSRYCMATSFTLTVHPERGWAR